MKENFLNYYNIGDFVGAIEKNTDGTRWVLKEYEITSILVTKGAITVGTDNPLVTFDGIQLCETTRIISGFPDTMVYRQKPFIVTDLIYKKAIKWVRMANKPTQKQTAQKEKNQDEHNAQKNSKSEEKQAAPSPAPKANVFSNWYTKYNTMKKQQT